jgi:hypothetical protein
MSVPLNVIAGRPGKTNVWMFLAELGVYGLAFTNEEFALSPKELEAVTT